MAVSVTADDGVEVYGHLHRGGEIMSVNAHPNLLRRRSALLARGVADMF